MGLGFGTGNLNDNFEPDNDLRSLEYPGDANVPRLRMDRWGLIEEFPEVVLRAIKYYQDEIMHKAKETWVPVVVGYPIEKVHPDSMIDLRSDLTSLNDMYFLRPFADMISYSLVRQTPMGLDGMFSAKRARPALFKETFPVDGHPGMFYQVSSYHLDNLVQFDCWSSNTRGADYLASWFKTFMEVMKGSIERQGYAKILFVERGEDKTIPNFREDITCRSLRYFVRSEEQHIIPVSTLKQIDLDTQVRYSLDSEEDVFLREMQGLPVSGYTPEPSGLPEPEPPL